MPLGIHRIAKRISTKTDTELLDCGDFERIYLLWMSVDVETGGMNSHFILTDGLAGDTIMRFRTSTTDDRFSEMWGVVKPPVAGFSLTRGNSLYASTTGLVGAIVFVNAWCEVRGS